MLFSRQRLLSCAVGTAPTTVSCHAGGVYDPSKIWLDGRFFFCVSRDRLSNTLLLLFRNVVFARSIFEVEKLVSAKNSTCTQES